MLTNSTASGRLLPLQAFFSRYDMSTDIRKRTVTQFLSRHTNRRLMRDEALLRDMAPSMRVGGVKGS